MMTSHEDTVNRMLAHLALQKATEGAHQSASHGSTLCRIPKGSWQADTIRKSADMPQAHSPMDLRQMTQDPAMPVIFVPADAALTLDAIERICAESPLNKMIIWEADQA